MKKDLLAGVYRHYSGLMVLVIGIARHSETEEKFVVYVPLAPKAGPRLTVRPLEIFQEEMEVDGKKRSRFEYVGGEMPDSLAKGYLDMTNWGRPRS